VVAGGYALARRPAADFVLALAGTCLALFAGIGNAAAFTRSIVPTPWSAELVRVLTLLVLVAGAGAAAAGILRLRAAAAPRRPSPAPTAPRPRGTGWRITPADPVTPPAPR
jgi:hypothetical protein